LDNEGLKAAIHKPGLKQLDKVLILLLTDDARPKPPREIKQIGVSVGLRAIKNWNLSKMLGRSKGLAIAVTGGWEVSHQGREHLTNLGIIGDRLIAQQATTLRALLPKISSAQNREFIEEAVGCYEAKNLRAAAVLSWVGAVAILYDHVLKHALAKFDAENKRRNPKAKTITTADDLSDIKEFDFLDMLHAISVLGKSVKNELKQCLQFRNGCGHPNSLKIGETRVASHLETLINNVYRKF
jgi:hypothetical protein